MSDFVPRLDLVLRKAFDAKKDCVICGKRGNSSELVTSENGRKKVKQVHIVTNLCIKD